MKRASYREAIDWIANNDSAGDPNAGDPDSAGHLVSSVLIADIFDVSTERVGRDIVRARVRLGIIDLDPKLAKLLMAPLEAAERFGFAKL